MTPGIFDWVGDIASDITNVVAAPLKAVTAPIKSLVAPVLKSGTDVLKTGMGDVTQVARGSQQMFQGIAQPLTQGVGGAVQSIGSGLGHGVGALGDGLHDVGSGFGDMEKWLPIVGVGALAVFMVVEMNANKRGSSFIPESVAKRARRF